MAKRRCIKWKFYFVLVLYQSTKINIDRNTFRMKERKKEKTTLKFLDVLKKKGKKEKKTRRPYSHIIYMYKYCY